MVAMFVTTALHIPFCFLFVKGFDMGILGLAVASSVKDFLLMASVIVYCHTAKDTKVAL